MHLHSGRAPGQRRGDRLPQGLTYGLFQECAGCSARLWPVTVNLAIFISTRPGLGSRQVDAFERLAPLVRAESGCIQYEMHRSEDDDDQFILFEQWESQTDLDAHDLAPHMTAQDAANAEFRAGPVTVLRYAPQPIA